MAVFRVLLLLLLLQVGMVVVGSNLGSGLRSGRDEETGSVETHRLRPAQLRAPRRPAGLAAAAAAAELPQKLEEHLPRVVTAFLHSGDSTTLKHANCSRRYELTSLRGRLQGAPHVSMRGVLDTVLHATNFLNMILQANRSRQHSLRRDIEWYHALVRSILEGDAKIHRAVVTFSAESPTEGPSVFLQATRAGGEIVLQDLSAEAHHHLHNRSADTEWYHGVRDKQQPTFHKRVLSQDVKSADNSLRRGESFIPDKTHVKWSAPYLECDNGNFVPRWLLTLSAAFYGLKPSLAPVFRGVVRVDVNLQDIDIDQCSANGWFAGTHRCNTTTMECLPLRGHGFVLDKYQCHCKKGFYHPSRVASNAFTKFAGKGGAAAEGGSSGGDEDPPRDCLPCQQGCAYCKNDAPCVAQEDSALRLAVLSFQCLCLLIVFVSMILIYHFRRNKSIRASGLVLLEAILCGALLLYFPVGILYFQPSVFRCILLRWVRLLGFATVYGTLTLKLYRVLKVFLSRTAQRIPYMTSWRVLRLLAVILLIVCWFLVAWTSAVCQNADRKMALIDVGYTPEGLQFSTCLLDRWDYMMAVAEFLFLLWAVYLCYAVRTVPSAFHEPRYMAIAVHNELILSAIFYVIRFTLVAELHPDWMLLLFFTHTHLTITVTLGLLLIPKFLFAGTQMRDDIASEAYEDELDMGRSGSYLNSSITSAWSEHSLDPEDIREELKKLYSQLEIYKRKKMLANNPHLQKKRSSKKGLGRSLMRRITEIPESVHRQCSREDKEAGEHGNNRNSICVLKKNPFDQTPSAKVPKEETLKNKVFSLKKSHSSYDHVRDQGEDSDGSVAGKAEVINAAESSLLDTLMGKKLARKTSSENVSVPSESTESVPLVCKSASAHNLTADKKPLHPRTSMLQKSLSVIASAKERTLGLTAKTQIVEDGGRKNQESENIGQGKAVESQEAKENVQTKSRTAKQPCSQPTTTHSEPVKAKDLYDLSEVCPWEVEDIPTTPSENKIQKHVSIAPTESTTVHGGGGTKGSKLQQQKQRAADQSPKSSRQPKETQRTAAAAAAAAASVASARSEVCPWEDDQEGQNKGTKQQTSKQVKTQPSHSATEASKTKLVEVCPWDFQEVTVSKESTLTPDPSKQKKGSSPVEAKGKSGLSDVSKAGGSIQAPPTRADVCPWDYDSTVATTATATSPGSGLGAVSPSRANQTKENLQKKSSTSPRTAENEKPKVMMDDDRSRMTPKDKPRESERCQVSQQKVAEVCPWDVDCQPEAVPLVEKRRSANVGAVRAKTADVCPWDFEDKNVSSANGSKTKPKSAASKADVCPWDFEDSSSSKKA